MIDMSAIKVLSVEQKLQVMEAIWQDISGEEETVQSPSWHQEALRETEQRCKAGKEAALPLRPFPEAPRSQRRRLQCLRG